jgi:hypothetical protein
VLKRSGTSETHSVREEHEDGRSDVTPRSAAVVVTAKYRWLSAVCRASICCTLTPYVSTTPSGRKLGPRSTSRPVHLLDTCGTQEPLRADTSDLSRRTSCSNMIVASTLVRRKAVVGVNRGGWRRTLGGVGGVTSGVEAGRVGVEAVGATVVVTGVDAWSVAALEAGAARVNHQVAPAAMVAATSTAVTVNSRPRPPILRGGYAGVPGSGDGYEAGGGGYESVAGG